MRPLTEDEMRKFFEKLKTYIGNNVRQLIDRKDQPHCFRLHKDKVYYVSESIMRQATNVGSEQLLLLGTCFGKFTKSRNVKLHITCLDYLSQYAKYKVWCKPSAEMAFLYGNHVPKAGLGRMTENVPQYGGVIVYNMANVPLGFGVASHPTDVCRNLAPTSHVVLHQADVGEYLRQEDTLNDNTDI
eukprot:g5738.t1